MFKKKEKNKKDLIYSKIFDRSSHIKIIRAAAKKSSEDQNNLSERYNKLAFIR